MKKLALLLALALPAVPAFADAAKPEESAQPEPPAEIDPRMEKMQRLVNASFPPPTGSASATATTAQPRTPDQGRQQQPQYGR